jgi:uncharacterized membrane protein
MDGADGAALLLYTIMRGSRPDQQMMRNDTGRNARRVAQGSIVVKAPVADVYKRWLAFEDYPKFITAIKRVRKLDENHFSASIAFQGKEHEAMFEISYSRRCSSLGSRPARQRLWEGKMW